MEPRGDGKKGEAGRREEEEEEDGYATDDPTATSAREQEDMAREAIKRFKSLG